MIDLITLLTHVIALGVGFVAGSAVNWKSRKIGGMGVLVPSFNLTPRRADVLLSLGVAAAVILTVYHSAAQTRQLERCLAFAEEVRYHRDHLAGSHREANRALLGNLVADLKAGELSPEEVIEYHEEFESRMEDMDEYIENNITDLGDAPAC